jgi:hypothetical protein
MTKLWLNWLNETLPTELIWPEFALTGENRALPKHSYRNLG